MSLHDYQRKRDFSSTPEPSADAKPPRGRRAIFVVQLHHASRRHFDFRLQVGDVLKSWAVPKGPSYNPREKRLAVEVEDHPVGYADFQGDIDEGYGKGHVDQFDRGVWATNGDAEAQLRKGHLRFELFGKRLKGEWHLVRSTRKERQPAWFLIKADDAFASDVQADDLLDARMTASTRRAARTPALKAAARKSTARKRAPPALQRADGRALAKQAKALAGARKASIANEFFKPELARLREFPPEGDGWIHEVKWDGYRLLATISGGEVKLWSRNALSWNERVPEIVQAVAAMGLDSARLDGELIALDSAGRSDFNGLQGTLAGEAQYPLVYMLFDLPALEGYDLTHAALTDRKALLAALLQGRPHPLAYSSHSVGHGGEIFRAAVAQQLEGTMAKRADSPYRPGRGDAWLKIKRQESDEFAVIGYTHPQGSRTGFGSLLLGRPDPASAGGWIYAGRVGTGFTEADLQSISQSLATRGSAEPPSSIRSIDPLLRGARWVKPRVVAEVFYRGIGNKQLLRQPSLKALRSDKSVADLRAAARSAAVSESGKREHGKVKDKRKAASPAIAITHPDREIFPASGITKQDVADYYSAVMDWFLPGVKGRPTSVIRCPEGIEKACFFQKHMMSGLHHVGSARLEEESGAGALYICPEDASSVIELVQFGTLEFHPWGATAAAPDLADRMVFDLDPGPDVAWERVVAAARLVHKLLDQLGLDAFLRTTGGKGLHVVVPLNPGCPWSQVKGFAQAFATSLAQAHPLDFVATAAKTQRKGRIYLDYLRNSRGATSVASYSLRARQGAPVAVPLRWNELGGLKSGHDFTIATLPRRLGRLKADPWEGIDALKQTLEPVLERLARGQRLA